MIKHNMKKIAIIVLLAFVITLAAPAGINVFQQSFPNATFLEWALRYGLEAVVDAAYGIPETGIERTETQVDGVVVKESFFAKAEAVSETIQTAVAAGGAAVTVEAKAATPQAAVEVKVAASSLKEIAENNLSLQVATERGSLELPSALLSALAEAETELSVEIETVTAPESVAAVTTALADSEPRGRAVGAPIRIETNFSGSTKVSIPLTGITFPAEPAARASFLNSLKVFTVHSDGDRSVYSGDIIFDAAGNPVSLSVPVDKFSTFTLIQVDEEEQDEVVIVLTVGSTAATVDNVAEELDSKPFIKPEVSRTMVPIRFVSEMLGASVLWVEDTRQVIITEGGKEIVMTIDSDIVLVDGVETEIDCPAEIVVNRTFVPVRFLSEQLGADVYYEGATQTITITR